MHDQVEQRGTDFLSFERDERGRVLRAAQWLPASIEVLWPFFSDATNLRLLTPPGMRFTVLTPTPIEMRVGTRIDYRVRVRGVPLRWRSAITAWEPGVRFVDEQLKGPYRQWVHEHRFEAVDGGTLCHDVVRYRVPMDALVHGLLVKRDLERIFAFRRAAMIERFGGGARSDG